MKHAVSTYAADDAKITVQSLEFLHQPAPAAGNALLASVMAIVAEGGDLTVSQVAALRKSHSAEHLHAALTLARLQKKAVGPRGKYPQLPFLWATPEALEQATSSSVARHKAARFAALAPTLIVDCCAGIGGDTLALAEVAPVIAIDLSPVRTTCLRYNAERATQFPIDIRTADLRSELAALPPNALFHADPARRAASAGNAARRSPRYADLIPGPEVLEAIMTRFPQGGAIKLSPAVDFDSLPIHRPTHLELISERGSVVQAVLWIGTLAATLAPPQSRMRTATADGESFQGAPAPVVIPTGALQPPYAGRVLCELDGTLSRAALAQPFAEQFHLSPLTHDGGYALLQSHAPAPLPPAFATRFRLHDVVPFSEKRIAKILAELPGQPSAVAVKSRGRLPGIDTDHLQRVWSPHSRGHPTVLLFEHKKDVLAAIAWRERDTVSEIP